MFVAPSWSIFVILSDDLPFPDGPLPLFGISVHSPQLGCPTFGSSVRCLRLARRPTANLVSPPRRHRVGTAWVPPGRTRSAATPAPPSSARARPQSATTRYCAYSQHPCRWPRARPPAPAPSARALLRIGRSVRARLWARDVPGVLGVGYLKYSHRGPLGKFPGYSATHTGVLEVLSGVPRVLTPARGEWSAAGNVRNAQVRDVLEIRRQPRHDQRRRRRQHHVSPGVPASTLSTLSTLLSILSAPAYP
jgi:hypothetical protein